MDMKTANLYLCALERSVRYCPYRELYFGNLVIDESPAGHYSYRLPKKFPPAVVEVDRRSAIAAVAHGGNAWVNEHGKVEPIERDEQ